jgi:hypothetical protein
MSTGSEAPPQTQEAQERPRERELEEEERNSLTEALNLAARATGGEGKGISTLDALILMDLFDRREERRRRLEESRTSSRSNPEFQTAIERIESRLSELSQRLEKAEEEKRLKSAIDEAVSRVKTEKDHEVQELRRQLEEARRNLEEITKKVEAPKPTPEGAADIKIKELPQLKQGLQAIGLDIAKTPTPEANKQDTLETEIASIVRENLLNTAKEAVKKGLMKEEEVIDKKTGKPQWAGIVNRFFNVAEKFVEKMQTTPPEERVVREIQQPPIPQGPPEAARIITPAPPQPPAETPQPAPTAETKPTNTEKREEPASTLEPKAEAETAEAKQPEAHTDQHQAGPGEATQPTKEEGSS